MFGNKKNNLPPRPHIPDPEHILEDLNNTTVNDAAFKLLNKDTVDVENSFNSTTTNNSDDIYKKVKTYLSVKQQLKQLETTLQKEKGELYKSNEEILILANDIREQAKAALIT